MDQSTNIQHLGRLDVTSIMSSPYITMGGSAMASVTFEHVSKRFGDVIAVNDLNLAVQDREFLVLVGPSGCGKTTALRALARLEEISEGRILIGGRRVNAV